MYTRSPWAVRGLREKTNGGVITVALLVISSARETAESNSRGMTPLFLGWLTYAAFKAAKLPHLKLSR